HTSASPPFSVPHPALPRLYPLSLHDALPISDPDQEIDVGQAPEQPTCEAGEGQAAQLHDRRLAPDGGEVALVTVAEGRRRLAAQDRKSTRLNSSHGSISYAVFCLNKKNTNIA